MMSTPADCHQTSLHQNTRTGAKRHQFANNQQLSTAESSTGPHKNAENGASEVPISTDRPVQVPSCAVPHINSASEDTSRDLWESPVQEPSSAVPRKKLGNSNSASEVIFSKDFLENSVQEPSGVVPRKTSGYANSTSKVNTLKNFWESKGRDPCGAGFQKDFENSNIVSLENSNNCPNSRTEELEDRASELPTKKDFWENPIQEPSGAVPREKSRNFNNAFEVTFSTDFCESPMQDPGYAVPRKKSGNLEIANDFCESKVRDLCGAGFHKKPENSNRAYEAPKSWRSIHDLLGAGPHKKSGDLLESLDLATHQRFLGFSDSSASFTIGNHSTLNFLTGDVSTRLSVYDDGVGHSGSKKISKISSNSRTDKLRQEKTEEVGPIYTDDSSTSSDDDSSDATSSSVSYNNGNLEIPNARQTSFRIGTVTNLNPQYITDDGTDLLRHTANVMEGVKCYFDISHTKAWKSVLDTDKIVFLVGFSQSFKKLISLKFYQKYKSRVDVFRLNGPEDAKICYKRSKPFAIFMEEAFGPLGKKFERISHVIKDLSAFKHLEAALFMMDPLSFERNKESLRKCIKRRLVYHVVHLEEEEHLLSEEEKRENLEKSSELVKKEDRSLTKQHIDKIMCFENPIFFDTCEEFVDFNRHDKNVRQFFSLPLDCLIGDIRYLKEKWPDGYYVLRLVAFHKVFDQSENSGELFKHLRLNIQGNLPQILNQLVGSYLEIQHSEAIDSQANLSSPKFAFRHCMMQCAVLCTETDKAFLIAYCPTAILVQVIAQMTNMREISFEDKKRNIAKRFIQEILKGKHVATMFILDIWNSEEFMEDFKQEWETVERQSLVPNIMSVCESEFVRLAVFNKSPKLLDWILKICKEQNVQVSLSTHKQAIFSTCVIGHFEHFKLLMEQILDSFCITEFMDQVSKRNTEIDFDETMLILSDIRHIAVAYNRLNILDYIKKCGQNVNYTDSQGCTSLHVACLTRSDIETLEYLKQNNGDVANVTDKHGNTCLHAACCRYDNIEIVTWLVKDFPNLVSKRNTQGITPIQIAAGVGNTQILELLIEISNKFQENCLLQKDSSGCTVLHLACEVHSNLQMVKFLLEMQPSLITIQDDDDNTALHVACSYGNIEIVTWLVKDYPNLVLKRNTAGRTPLHRVVEVGNTQILELLIEISNKFQENFLLEKDSSGCTVLHLACTVNENLQIIHLLLERQPSLINIEDHHGNTALHIACCYDNIEIVTSLVNDYPNLVLKRNTAGRTPLHAAVVSGNTKIVELLIEISNKFQENCLLQKDSSGCTVLHLACFTDHDNLQIVNFLLERQPSLINIEDHHGNTALHIACSYDNIEIVTSLVNDYPNLVLKGNTAGRTPLHKAFVSGNNKIMELLIEISNKRNKNSLLQKDSSGCTFLHWACVTDHDNLQIVNFLLERQPSLINIQDHDGNTALHIACFYDNIEIVTSLVKNYPNLVLKGNTVGRTPLHAAVVSGNIEIVKLLIEISNKRNKNSLLQKDSSGRTVIHFACEVVNNLQMVKFLLERQPSLINIQDHHGNTALHVACSYGNIEIVTALVHDYQNLVLKRNAAGQTPLHAAVGTCNTTLHAAAKSGNTQIVELLIEISNKFQENFLLEQDSSGRTVLHWACVKDHDNLQMVKSLYERQPSLINIDDNHGNTALHVACCYDNIKIVTSLVHDYPNLVLNRNTAGLTPLHVVAQRGNTKIAELLIEISNKFQENFLLEKDSSGYTVLHMACKVHNNLQMIFFLLEKQPSLINIQDDDGNTVLHIACLYGNIEIVTALVNDYPNLVLNRNTAGITPLHVAAKSGNTKIVELLIEIRNFEDNFILQKDSYGRTVLHWACVTVHDNLQMVKFLLERQPSLITIQDHDGNTALHVSCQRTNKIEVIEFLLSKGMDINIVNNSLRTPLHTACMAENVEVVQLLLEKENIQISKDKDNKYPYQLTKNKSVLDKFAKFDIIDDRDNRKSQCLLS